MENENNVFREGLVGNTQSPNELAKNDANEDVQKIRNVLSEEEKKFSEEEIEDFKELLDELNKGDDVSVAELQDKAGLVKSLIIEYLNSVGANLNLTDKDIVGAFRKQSSGELGYIFNMEKDKKTIFGFTISNIDFLKRCLSTAISTKEKDELRDVSLRNKDDLDTKSQVSMYIPIPDKSEPIERHHMFEKMKKIESNIVGHYSYGHKTFEDFAKSQNEGR